MDEWQVKNLDKALFEIERSLDVRGILLGLQVSHIFDGNDSELVLNDAVHRTESEKRFKIVELLKSRGPRAYYKFAHYAGKRSPQIYQMLHDPEDANIVMCIVCNGSEEEEFRCCNYCAGLVNVFSDYSNGVFIEKAEDIVTLFHKNQEKIESLRAELGTKTTETTKLRNDLFECITHNIIQLATKDQQLAAKEDDCKGLLQIKDSVSMEKEALSIKHQELSVEHHELKQRFAMLEKEHKSLAEQCEGVNECFTGEESIYSNYLAIIHNRQRELEAKAESAEQKVLSLAKELTTKKTEISRICIEKEAVEVLLQRQTVEHDRVFTEKENQLERARNNDAAERKVCEELREKIESLTKEKQEFVTEKNSLVQKLYEKDNILREVQEELSAVETQHQKLKHRNETQVDSLLADYSNARKERDEEREKNSKLIDAKDNLVLRILESEQKTYQEHNTILEANRLQIFQLQQQIANLKDELLQARSKPRQGDFEIVLQRTRNGRFGVTFGLAKGAVFVWQSNIVVLTVDYENISSAPLADISESDYVIKINDVNVQEADMQFVKEVFPENDLTVRLTLRRPQPVKTKLSKITVQPGHQSLEDMGIRLAVVAMVKEGKSPSGIYNWDEVIQINRHRTDSLAIEDICSKVRQSFKRKNPIDVTMLRLTAEEPTSRQTSVDSSGGRPPALTPRSREASVDSSWSLLSLPPALNSQLSTSSHSNFTVLYDEPYSYVDTQRFDNHGNPVSTPKDAYESIIKTVVLAKKEYESFGFNIIGGNKIGIFIQSITEWKAASIAGWKVGWKILKINDYSLDQFAFCFVIEYLNSLKGETQVKFQFEVIQHEMYQHMLSKKPHDSFHVQALRDYKPQGSGELGFKKGEVLNVIDSYVIRNPEQGFKWLATKDGDMGMCNISGLIPNQISARSPCMEAEHPYKCMNGQGSAEPQPTGQESYYKILDFVGKVPM